MKLRCHVPDVFFSYSLALANVKKRLGRKYMFHFLLEHLYLYGTFTVRLRSHIQLINEGKSTQYFSINNWMSLSHRCTL